MKPITTEELPLVQRAIEKATSNSGLLTPSETELLARAAAFYVQDRLYWEELFAVDVELTDKGI